MRGTNRIRALIVSTAVILMCMSVVVGMTWALFTDRQAVRNHLQAGDLTITLKRTELTKTTLNASGYLEEIVVQTADNDPVNFTNPSDENVFGINGDDEKIVPGSKFVAKMQIENNSDVAFGYWIEIVCTDQTNGEDLAKQLKITVNTGSDQNGLVSSGLAVTGPDGGNVGRLAVGEKGTFTVTVEFLDSAIANNQIDDNNLAKKETVEFDLVVHAVQLTSAP